MTREQLIEAMTLLGYVLDVDYGMQQDYDSILMEGELVKPEEQELQSVYDAEQARLAEEARLDALQARIDAIPDLILAIDSYLKSAPYAGEEGSFNIAGIEDARKLESSFGWDFPNKAKPDIDDLEAVNALVYSTPKWANLRRLRNEKLADCDWTQLADSPLSANDKASWAAYRQQLRDLPDVTADPDDPNWPVEPQ